MAVRSSSYTQALVPACERPLLRRQGLRSTKLASATAPSYYAVYAHPGSLVPSRRHCAVRAQAGLGLYKFVLSWVEIRSGSRSCKPSRSASSVLTLGCYSKLFWANSLIGPASRLALLSSQLHSRIRILLPFSQPLSLWKWRRVCVFPFSSESRPRSQQLLNHWTRI